MSIDPIRARELFLAVIELPPLHRSNYLTESCGGDAELRGEIERLLAAHSEPASLLNLTAPKQSDGTGTCPPGETQSLETATGESQQDGPTAFAGAPPMYRQPEVIPGTVIASRYSLIRLLGEGGMGAVYLASQSEPVKRQVALKLIRSGMDSRTVLARFESERQALALMDHPNIARVYDGGTTASGQPFFVMELVDGPSITEYCDRLRLPLRARLELFIAVCHAVQHAHQKGVIHRDLKPSNVMVAEVDGRPTPKVIDFGVAKATQQKLTDISFADTGAIVGTPAYMSPEQADPSSMDIDTRTDVYSLGVILYELLVGTPPLEAKQFKRVAILEMLRMVREVDPPRPSTKLSTSEALPNIAANRHIEPEQLKRAVRGDLDWIVMKSLEKDRTRRYETANGFAADILRHLAYEPVLAAPPSRAYRMQKFVRKHRGPVIAASLILLALIGGAFGTVYGVIKADGERVANGFREEAESARDGEKKQREVAEKARDALKQAQDALARVEYGRTMRLAYQAWLDNDLTTARRLLSATLPELRGWEWRYVHRICHADLVTFRPHATNGSLSSFRFSPDGTRVVTVDHADREPRIRDSRTGTTLLTLRGHTGDVQSAAFSADGTRVLAASADGTARIWDAKTGTEKVIIRDAAGSHLWAEFAPGERVMTSTLMPGGRITPRLWDAATGEEVMTLKEHLAKGTLKALSPDGGRALFIRPDKTIFVADARTGAEGATIRGLTAAPVFSASFSPDGTRVLTAGIDKATRIWDAATGTELAVLEGYALASFSPKGSRVLLYSGPAARVWDGRTGGEVVDLKGHTGNISWAAFDAAGKKVGTTSTDGTARVWDAKTGAELFVIRDVSYSPVAGNYSEFSPDGTRLMSRRKTGSICIWDARTGAEETILTGDDLGVRAAGFSPDGVRAVFATRDGHICVRDVQTGADIVTLAGAVPGLSSAAFSADGRRMLTIALGDLPRLWDTQTGAELTAFKADGPKFGSGAGAVGGPAAAFSPNGERVVIVDDMSTARIRDTQSGAVTATLRGHTGRVASAAYSPDGKHVVTAAWDGTVRIWDASAGAEVRAFEAPSGRFDYTTPEARRVLPFHEQSLLQRKRLESHFESAIYSPDGARVATAGGDGTVRIWDVRTGAEVAALVGSQGRVLRLAFSPDGERVATASSGPVRVWDARSGNEYLSVKSPPGAAAVDVAFGPDGETLCVSSAGFVQVWDARPVNADFLPDGATPLLTLSKTSDAENPVPKKSTTPIVEDQRRVFETKGASSFTQMAGKRWLELRTGGSPSEFIETERTAEYVELHDGGRDLKVRILNRMAAAFNKETKGWVPWPGSEGRWRLEHLPEDIVNAWKKAGAQVGWIRINRMLDTSQFIQMTEGEPGDVPGFYFTATTKGLSNLPSTTRPVGLMTENSPARFVDDAWLKGIWALPNLQVLELPHSRLTNASLEEIGKLAELRRLNLWEAAAVTDSGVKQLIGLNKLESLRLDRTRVTDAGAVMLAELKNLRDLSINNCPLTDKGVQALAGLSKLRSLSLGGTDLGAAGLKELTALKELQFLGISKTPTTDAGMDSVAQLSNLQSLGLVDTKVTDAGLKKLAGLKRLQTLTLDAHRISDSTLVLLRENGLLHALTIYPSYLPGASRPSKLEEVLSFDLSGTQVTGAGLRELAGLKSLNVLRLAETRVTDAGLKEVAALSELQWLVLARTDVTDDGLKHLAGLQKLRILDLSYTNCTPAAIKGFQKSLPNCQVHSNGAGPGQPKALPPDVVAAWREAGAEVGWLRPDPIAQMDVFIPVAANWPNGMAPTQPGDVPAFRFPPGQELRLAKLPPSSTAFGLDLGFNPRITDNEVKQLAGLVGLQRLKLASTGVTGVSLSALKEIKELRAIDLSFCQVNDEGMKSLASLKQLQIVTIVSTKVTDEGLKELAGLRELQHLNLQGLRISENGLKELAALESLKTLKLPATGLTDLGITAVSRLKSLHTLSLDPMTITDRALGALGKNNLLHVLENATTATGGRPGKLEDITRLSLSGCAIGDEGLKELAACKSLKLLQVERTKVTDAGVKELQKTLPECKIIR